MTIAFLWKRDFLSQKSKKPVILASRIPLFNVSMNMPFGWKAVAVPNLRK